ncbi:efflux transporter outer membrane subunit [Sphingomonas naphthae]|uniref:Efflux transporter outer membrane subunit n=1 Tax=Sphingomonas naphthae TaxID=1813468 RepID=A0ABY7THE5_9SPHN|nr:efflux transporter outer membrane subunit [Sphingomonas naphthae]WCT72574.1 efflux transporter outer membrane subunit [Sphingomonas naphthae]
MSAAVKRAVGLTALVATLLSGCSMAPKYERPAPLAPQGWPVGDAYLRRSEASLPAVDWREIFRDPKLQALIEKALTHNQNLAQAAANVAQARAQYRITRADLFPTITGGADASVQRSRRTTVVTGTGGTTTGGSTAGERRTSYSYSADVGLSAWEIDLFGRIRNQTSASFNRYLGTEAGARGTRLTLVAEVANAYLTLAADRDLYKVAGETAASARRSVDLTQARLSGGIAPRTDLSAAETTLATAESDLAEQTTAIAQDRNALNLLVGMPLTDAELPESLAEVDGMLGELPAGLDSGILLRRPDVLQAEYELRATNAEIGAARAAFFPRITLTGLVGFASTALSALFTGGAFAWSGAAGAAQTLFDGGATANNLKSAKAGRDAAVAGYQLAIQTAFTEVSDALARRGTIDAQYAAQQRRDTAAAKNYELADASYRGGITGFLDALIAQRTLYTARQALVATRLVKAQNLVTLYRTLGGDRSIADTPIDPAHADEVNRATTRALAPPDSVR